MAGVICFHKPEEANGWLSNWYLSDFIFDGITYSSMEQYTERHWSSMMQKRPLRYSPFPMWPV